MSDLSTWLFYNLTEQAAKHGGLSGLVMFRVEKMAKSDDRSISVNDETIEIATLNHSRAALVAGILLSIFMGCLSWSFGMEMRERPVQHQMLTAGLFAILSVIVLWIAVSYAGGYSSASVRGEALTIRRFRRRWEIPVDQVRFVERIAAPFQGTYALRIVFDERSPIRDALLDVSWMDEPVATFEELVEKAKQDAGRNAPFRPA